MTGLDGTSGQTSAEFDYFSTSRSRREPPAPPPPAPHEWPEPYGAWGRGNESPENRTSDAWASGELDQGGASRTRSSQPPASQWPDQGLVGGDPAQAPAEWNPWRRTSGGMSDYFGDRTGVDSRTSAESRTGAADDTIVGGSPPLPAWVPANPEGSAGPRGFREPQNAPATQDLYRPHEPAGDDPAGPRRSAQPELLGTRRDTPQRERQRPAEPDPTPPPRRKRQRDPYLDNVKFLLICLVPLGHALVPTLAASSARATYLFIYVFHMPLFVIISGYLSRNFWNSNAKTNKLVDTFVVPYVIVEVGYALLRTALGQKWSLTIMDPAWLNWYLVALLFWRLSTPVWKRMRYPVPIAIAIYLFAGFSNLSGDFSMDRFFGLLPFFVIGLVIKPELFTFLQQRWVRILSVLVLVAAAAVAIYLVKNYTVKLGPIYYKNSYAQLKLVWWKGMALRVALLAAALAMSAAVLSLVPRHETWFTDLGTRTLYCYLLHGVPVLIGKEMGWLSVPWLYGPLGVATIASASFALSIVLCLPITRTAFKWLLEPRLTWLYRKPRIQRQTR